MKLVGTDGQKFYSFNLEPGKYILGRKSDSDFSIPHKAISRRHAEITVENNGSILVKDLGSHNGTAVNDERLTDQRQVRLGDKITFGHTEFKIRDDADTGTVTATKNSVLPDEDLHKSVVISLDKAFKQPSKTATDFPEIIPTISEMARMLVLNEPQEVMLQRSLELISKLIPSERLAVIFVSEDQTKIEPAATLISGSKDPGAFQLSKTIVNEVIMNKNAVLIGDPEKDPRFSSQESIIMSDIKSALAVPILDDDHVLGILYSDTVNPMNRFNNDHAHVMAIFGNIMASRLVNLALLSEREEKRIIESELQRASEIQGGLLPRSCPEFNGYGICAFQEQSRSVGGDLYDMAILPDGRMLFLVADVSGKGIGAALLMSNILAAFRILYGNKKFGLEEVVKQVSLQMYKYTDSGVFATLFIGLVEPGVNKVKFINAGHNPPLIVRSNGEVEYLKEAGVMIGAFDFTEWNEAELVMNDGDQLVIYSDGVTEAYNADEQYGEERMENTLKNCTGKSPKETAEYLVGNVRKFVGNEPQSDDITIMIIKKQN